MIVPPHSETAERALLACCLVDGAESVLTAEASGLTEADFYSPANALLFARFRAMVAAKVPVDIATLAEELAKAKELDACGGAAGLSRLADEVATTASRAYFIDEVAAKARFRAVRRAAMALQEAAQVEDADKVQVAVKAISEATAPKRRLSSIADACKEARRQMEDARAGIRPLGVFGLGVPAIDRHFGLFRRGELACIGARPGFGKTSLLLNCAIKAAHAGHRVRFYGLEMSNEELVTIAAGIITGHSPREVIHGHDADFAEYCAGFDQLAVLKNFTLIDCDRSHEEIVSRTRAAALRGQIDGVFIDYLQRVKPPKMDKGATRAQAIGEMTREFKQMARDIAAPVIVAAQINRAGDGSDDTQPTMANLRESGDIEADCDRIALLHRPSTNADGVAQAKDDPTAHMLLIVDKNRKGPTGQTWMAFNRPTQRFSELAPLAKS
jgi:replicative DNA helicase